MKAKLMALADDACTHIHGERYEVMLEAPSAIVWVAKGVVSSFRGSSFRGVPMYCMYRYLQSPWLCNLDWSSKKFRGKAKKSDMKKLLDQIEEHYKQRDEEFSAGKIPSRERDEGEKKGGGESGEKVEFFISGDGPGKRAVHMPGYPE